MNIDNLISEIEEEFAEKFTEIVWSGQGVRVFKQQIYRQDVERFLIKKLRFIAEEVSKHHKRRIVTEVNKLKP